MVSMMLVAGGASKSLADFFEKRGTFAVTNKYTSLEENISEIQSQIIKVDKLLYLFNSEATTGSVDIRMEMRLLGKLLKDSTFFNPAEIIFMLKAGENNDVAVKYFKTIVEDAKYDNYAIKVIEGKLTYDVVYSSVMGISQVRDFNNTYRSIYKVSRDSTAELAYAAQDNQDMVVQLENNYRMNDYESHRDLLLRTSSRNDINLEQKSRNHAVVDISSVGVEKREPEHTVVVITGAGKSGKSIWTSVLSASAVDAGKKALVIDLTDNKDIGGFIGKTNVGCNTVSFKEFIEGNFTESIVCCQPTADEQNVSVPFINYVLNEVFWYDEVFVVTELYKYKNLEGISTSVRESILLTSSRERDITYISKEVLPALYGSICIILNNEFTEFSSDELMDNREIRKIISDKHMLIAGKRFTSLDADGTYYKGVVK